jgi:hypothetical protein
MPYRPHRLEPNYPGPEVVTTPSPAPPVVVECSCGIVERMNRKSLDRVTRDIWKRFDHRTARRSRRRSSGGGACSRGSSGPSRVVRGPAAAGDTTPAPMAPIASTIPPVLIQPPGSYRGHGRVRTTPQ